jgi:hypothetical protein
MFKTRRRQRSCIKWPQQLLANTRKRKINIIAHARRYVGHVLVYLTRIRTSGRRLAVRRHVPGLRDGKVELGDVGEEAEGFGEDAEEEVGI